MYLNIISFYLISCLVSTILARYINLQYLKYLANEGYKMKMKYDKKNKNLYPEPLVKIGKFYTLIPIFNLSYVISKLVDLKINKNEMFKKLYKQDKIIRMDQDDMNRFADNDSYSNVVNISYNTESVDKAYMDAIKEIKQTYYLTYNDEKGQNMIVFDVKISGIDIIKTEGPISDNSEEEKYTELLKRLSKKNTIIYQYKEPKKLVKSKKNKKD